MARVKLNPPPTVLYRTQMQVQVGDLNYGNHLANDAVLKLVHEARLRWLATGGFSEIDAGGAGLIMADAMVQYAAQSFYGEVLDFAIGIGEITGSGIEIYTTITRKADDQLIALVKNGMVFFDYQQQKVAKVPERFVQFLGG